MAPKESPYPADWRRIAKKDHDRAKRLLEDDDPEGAAFFLQQALEKFLKAFLLSKGWSLRKIHGLEELLNDALRFDATLEKYRPLCQTVTEYYIEERYPAVAPSNLTRDEIHQHLEAAEALIQHLEGS